MNKNILYVVFFLVYQFSLAQHKFTKPDYKVIKAAIENKNLESYYPKLMERMKVRDTTLTADDYRNLYYGYTFQKEYEPYGSNSNDEKLKKYFQKDTLVASDYKPFIKLANKSLEENPFDLRIMNMLSYIYHLDKDENMSVKTATVLNGIINTIIASGDGLSCETALHVISVSHEYTILSVFELESMGQSLIGNCDYLRFEKGKYKVEGLYFDVSKLFASMMGKN